MGCKRNVKPEMAELKGRRLIIASEMEEGMRLNTAVVKQLCSTDEIQAEKKYKDPFQFIPSHTLVLYTNHLPKVGANDDGIWRRLVVIPFNAHIVGDTDIKNYADYLFENAGPAILAWIIEGAQKAVAQNFKTDPPQCVKDAVQAYREDNDWLGRYIDECCEVGSSYQEKSGSFTSSTGLTASRTASTSAAPRIFIPPWTRRALSGARRTRGCSCMACSSRAGRTFWVSAVRGGLLQVLHKTSTTYTNSVFKPFVTV